MIVEAAQPGPSTAGTELPPDSTVEREGRSEVQFDPIKQQRSHEYVADQIRRQIDLRLILPGRALPPERELAQQFGVGRATVQLALRELELDHLVESRRGRRGGTFVTGPEGDDRAAEVLMERILAQGQALEEMLTWRSVLEPGVAQTAAKVRGRGDLRVMGRALREMKGKAAEPEYMRHDSEFHLALAAASGNRYMVEAVATNRSGLGDLTSLLPESDAWHERNDHEHETILRAVSEGDAGLARAAMELHVANANQSARAMLAALGRRVIRKRGRR